MNKKASKIVKLSVNENSYLLLTPNRKQEIHIYVKSGKAHFKDFKTSLLFLGYTKTIRNYDEYFMFAISCYRNIVEIQLNREINNSRKMKLQNSNYGF